MMYPSVGKTAGYWGMRWTSNCALKAGRFSQDIRAVLMSSSP
jgi:hypothetical protein